MKRLCVLAWRWAAREWRAGELRLMALALVLAVAAVSSVTFFTDRIRAALQQEAHQLIGADLLLIADHPWPDGIRELNARHPIRQAETHVFPSMVVAGQAAQLADIKAVSPGYPLRGQLRISSAVGQADQAASGVPRTGEVWGDERLAITLGVKVGDLVQIGQSTLRFSAILTVEPDRGVNFFSVAPRLMMALEDLPETGLIQTGSRVTYRLLLAGSPAEIDVFRNALSGRLQRGERIEDTQNARPEIRLALDRAQRFLGLSSLLTVVLAAVAMALAAERYMRRHLDACAIMRCLGGGSRQLLAVHAIALGWLAVLAAIVGVLLGYLGHYGLSALLLPLLAIDLPSPSWWPAFQGGATAALLLFGFAFPPLLRLARVPPLRVLRREMETAGSWWKLGYLLGGVLLAGLMIWVAGDWRLGGMAVLALSISLAGFVALAGVMILFSGRLRRFNGGLGWQQGLAHLKRHLWGNTLQIAALAIGFLAMLLLTVTRDELLTAWEKATPADAPNRFVINIQPEQAKALASWITRALPEGNPVSLPAPMVRARLQRIGSRVVSPGDYPGDDRAQRLVEREFNLSWQMQLPEGNQVSAGRWFTPQDVNRPLASVEEGLARTLGVRIGDVLSFMVAGQELRVEVVGFRKLSWDSMRVNFFVLTPPGVLENYPASHILAYRQNQGPDLSSGMIRMFPNLTVIDVSAIVGQLKILLDQVAMAVQFVFLFTLFAGVVVLHGALVAVFDARRQEMAIMRALGAQRSQLTSMLLVELGAIGFFAGAIAAVAAECVGIILAREAFSLVLTPSFWLPPLASLIGGLATMTVGWLNMRRLVMTPAIEVLREV